MLDAERNLFNAQLSQAALQDAYLAQIINVYTALGYGWPLDEPAVAGGDRRPTANRSATRVGNALAHALAARAGVRTTP